MKVKILRGVISGIGVFSPGNVVTVDDAIARSWIEARLAVPVTEPSKNQATAGPSETKNGDADEDGVKTDGADKKTAGVTHSDVQGEDSAKLRLGHTQKNDAYKRRLRR